MQDDFREAAELLGIADPSLVEKDYHILRVLEAVLPIESDIFHVAFAGGTSLSRAYGAIKRMSEDADIKLVRKDPEQQITDGQIARECKMIRLTAIGALAEVGLPVPDDREHRIVLDGRKLVHLHIPYETQLPQALALRPEIKLDLFASGQSHDIETLPLRSLLAEAIGDDAEIEASVISLADTAAEKIVCLARRSAEVMRGDAERDDERLIRHVYDVCKIGPLIKSTHQLSQKT